MKSSRSAEFLCDRKDANIQAWTGTDHSDGEESSITSRELAELQREKIGLKALEAELRAQLSEMRTHCSTNTSFAPIASIFPQSRDSFGLSKSSSQQLQIYRKEWQFVHKRYTRANDTRYAYDLERTIEEKQTKVKELERKKGELRNSIYGVEREIVKMKGKDVEQTDTAQMRDLSAHVSLLRDQVRTLEAADAANRSLFQSSQESLSHAKIRHKKMKQIARENHISLRSPRNNVVKMTVNLMEKRINRVRNWDCFAEEQRIKELLMEKSKYEQCALELKEELQRKEREIGRKQASLKSLGRGRGASERASPVLKASSLSSFRLRKEVSLMLTRRDLE